MKLLDCIHIQLDYNVGVIVLEALSNVRCDTAQ